MAGERVQDSDWDDDFARIVAAPVHDRPQPVGPYMRWPLGAALALLLGQVAAAALDAIAAAELLTGGHSFLVTTASLAWTLAVSTVVAGVLSWAAYAVRARRLPALYAALAVEALEVLIRGRAVLSAPPRELGPYIGLLWALAALVALAVPSSRAYCTRRRTSGAG